VYVRFKQVEVKASDGYPVHNLNTGLNYTSIQEAVDAPETLDGHRIFVEKGTYYEHVVVNKAVRLIGENRTTMIHGYGVGPGIQVVVNNVRVSGFTIRRCKYGISLEKVSNCIIKENLVIECEWGILLFNSGGNTLRSNNMTSNGYNFGVGGSPPVLTSEMINDIDTSNIVDSKAIYYLVNQHHITINGSTSPPAGYVAVINSTNIVVKDLNLTHNRHSVLFFKVSNSTIKNIRACDNNRGITVSNCLNCTISRNTVIVTTSAYTSGLEIFYSDNVSAFENTIVNTTEGFMLYSSQNVALDRNTVNFTTYGVNLLYSNSSIIQNNTVTKNVYGMSLGYSINNTLVENNVIQNNCGIAYLYPSSHNIVYHNNFVENNKQAYINTSINLWSNGFEGNFWSDYLGADYDHDGIGDRWYGIDEGNVDYYPLMGMFCSFNTSLGYYVNVISNSTIENFEYFDSNSTIKMHVSNVTANQTFGFSRICIPHALMNETYHVTIDGAEPYYVNYTLYDDGDNRWIYFSYEHSMLEIVIVPEFPSFLILPLFMIATLLTVIVYKRKYSMKLMN